MKRITLTGLFVFLINAVFGQISLQKTYDYSTSIVKLETLGYKYYLMDVPNSQVRIYNLDHSLFKTINCTVPEGCYLADIKYISENLFIADSQIELVYTFYKYVPTSNSYYYIYGARVINERESNLLSIDDAQYIYVNKTRESEYKLFAYCFDYSLFPEKVWTNIYDLSSIMVSAREVNLGNIEGSFATVNVSSNTSWTASSSQPWLTVNPTSGTGNGTITMTATANPTTASRTATITVSAMGSIDQTVVITQEAGSVFLNISDNEATLSYSEGSFVSVNVSSNTNWTASSDQSWLTVNPETGTGNGTIIMTATANPSTASRTAKITVSAMGSIDQIVVITQEAGSVFLNISDNEATLSYSEGSFVSVNISSNTNWTASSDQSWLTVNPATGTGNGTITMTATANPTTASRTATITVSAMSAIYQTIGITQEFTTEIDVSRRQVSELFVYPNPIDDGFRLEGIKGHATLVLTDLIGKKLFERKVSEKEYISTSTLPQGVYLINISSGTERFEFKLIKSSN